VGFYASTFDPPTTRSQIRMIHCALENDGLHKECGELGKSISRLVVLVIEESEKDTFASTREQILMVEESASKGQWRSGVRRYRGALFSKIGQSAFRSQNRGFVCHIRRDPG
jgi:hypothetical protein